MMRPEKIYEALNWASSFLKDHNREERAAEWLLENLLGVNRTGLLVRFHDPLDRGTWETFRAQVERHASGIPIQHIIGYAPFFGREFKVSRDVLIPRPETEELIEHTLGFLSGKNGARTLCDIGTGSGIIAITMALEAPNLAVTAVDISENALNIARENSRKYAAPVTFYQGDLCQPLIERGERVDVLLSNPPYIPDEDVETLDVVVKDHDPHLALKGGADGLDLYRRLAAELPEVTNPGAFIGFEIGDGQGGAVAALIKAALPACKTEVKKDINGRERMVFAHRVDF